MKKTLIIFSLLLSFFLSSCSNKQVVDNTDITNNKESNQNQEIVKNPISDKDQKQYSLAMKENNEEYCEKIEDEKYKQGCISFVVTEKVKKTQDIKLCDKITDKMANSSCKAPILLKQAKEKKDINLCNSLDSMMKTECQRSITLSRASESGDSSVCNSLDSMNKQDCIKRASIASAIASQNVTNCNSLDSMNKQDCLNEVRSTIAANKKDPTYCDKTKNNSTMPGMDNCKKVAISKIILSDPDEKYCSSLDSMNIDSCKIKVGVIKSILSGNDTSCEMLVSMQSGMCKMLYQEITQKLSINGM